MIQRVSGPVQMVDARPRNRFTGAQLEELERFIAQTVRAAGAITLQHFRQLTPIDNKRSDGGYDPVTAADRDAEAYIRAQIRERFPEHGIIGEEHGVEPGASDLYWVIDPIDGTRSFVTGQLHWGVLMALSDATGPLLGAMYQPVTKELFLGGARGAWLEHANRRLSLTTRRCAQIGQAVLCCTTPEMFKSAHERDGFNRVAEQVRLLRYGGDCYSYCMLAHGLVDLVIESSLASYDIQALIALIEAAGGGVVSWQGTTAADGGPVLAYGDVRLRDPVLALLG